jgi:DNA-binding transcriptional LysR family regulator
MRIKLRQLGHVLAVWRNGSFRRAAAEQNLSQPALSRSIQNLEEALGTPLFDRQAAELSLTRYGEAFIVRAEALLVQAAELERDMGLMKGLGLGRFSVAMGVHAAGVSGNRAVSDLLREHPGLQVRIELRHWRDVERMVRHRQVDIGFAEISLLQGLPELHLEPVGGHELVFFCRSGHPLLAGPAVTTAALDAYPFAGVPIPARLADLFPRNRNVDETTGDICPPILVEDFTAACAVVAGTDAFAAATPLQIENALRRGEVSLVPFRAPWLRLDYGFIQLASRNPSPASEAFIRRVKDIERSAGERNRALADEFFGARAPES